MNNRNDNRRAIVVKLMPILLSFLLVTGGTLATYQEFPYLTLAYLIGYILITVYAIVIIIRERRIPAVWPLLLVVLAVVLASIANTDLHGSAYLAIPMYLAMVGMAVIAERRDALADLRQAGWLALPLLVLIAPGESRNCWGYAAAVVAVVFLASGNKWMGLAASMAVIISTSRGSMLALAVAVLVLYRPKIKAWMVGAAGAGAAAVYMIRPATIGLRWSYYYQGIRAWLQAPVFGIGPGGLSYRRMIEEMSTDRLRYHPHAHNILVNILAEWGLVGLALVGAAAWLLYKRVRFQPWQVAIIAGTLAHSMVDMPLSWPGYLLIFGFVIGGSAQKTG